MNEYASFVPIVILVLVVAVLFWWRKSTRAPNAPNAASLGKQTNLNFRFTARSAAIFVAGLVGASVLSTITGNQYVGLGIMVIVVIYLARAGK